LALSDRFGLSLSFHALDQDAFLRIVAAYADRLGLPGDADARLARAIEWAKARGARSGRTAFQFILSEAASAGLGLERL
jgi:predicted AAA+ superfamily ATPase